MELPTRLKTNKTKVPAKATAADVAKIQAQEAVDQYHEMVSNLREAEKEFRTKYPDAADDLEQIKEYRDSISEHIERAKVLVRTAGVTIGEFEVTKKKSQPSYDPALACICLKEVVSRAAGELTDLDSAKGSAAAITWADAHDRMEGVYLLVHSLDSMLEAEVVKALAFEKDSAKLFFPANPHISEVFVKAWDAGGKELTPAVKVPKL
jgi:soluble cytochrome b562